MKKKHFTEEQIGYVLRQAEAGKPVAEICREMGISQQTFYRWRRKFAFPASDLSPVEVKDPDDFMGTDVWAITREQDQSYPILLQDWVSLVTRNTRLQLREPIQHDV